MGALPEEPRRRPRSLHGFNRDVTPGAGRPIEAERRTGYDGAVPRPIGGGTGRALIAALIVAVIAVTVAAALLVDRPRVQESPPPSATSATSPPPASPTPTSPEATPTETSPGDVGWSGVDPSGEAPSPRSDGTWTTDPSSAIAYLFGGRGSGGDIDDLWAYDLTADAWRRLEPAGERPTARREHVAAWVDGLGLVIHGGRTDSGVLDDLWAYDPGADAWRPLDVAGSIPDARAGACAAVRPDGRLWLFGGETTSELADPGPWIYDPGASEWSRHPVEDGPSGSGGAAGAACWWTLDGRFVVHGGHAASDPPTAVDDLRVLDPAGSSPGTWTEIADTGLSPRDRAASTVTGRGAVLVGGLGSDGAPMTDVVVFDATTIVPTVLASGSGGPAARSAASLVDDPEGERVLMFGGATAAGPSDELWALDLR